MTHPVPCGDYPSKTAAIRDMRDNKKMTVAEIASALGMTENNVRNLDYESRSRKRRAMIDIAIERETLDAARPYASKRNITPNELCRRILTQALDDDIVDAVLDDLRGHNLQ